MEVKPYFSQLFRVTPLAILVISTVLLVNTINLSKLFPIRNVQVYGANHIRHEQVEELLTPYVSRGFFSVDVEFIRDRLMQLPWVSKIFVRRHWPDQVEVAIFEKEVVGRWNGSSLLSAAGEIFSPEEKQLSHFPDFIGPDGSQMKMLEYYRAMNRILLPLHAKISYLELTPYRTWKLKMSNGMLLQIGHKEILTRLSHFVKVYPKIIGPRVADVEYVDLRYSNGVAVKWKSSL